MALSSPKVWTICGGTLARKLNSFYTQLNWVSTKSSSTARSNADLVGKFDSALIQRTLTKTVQIIKSVSRGTTLNAKALHFLLLRQKVYRYSTFVNSNTCLKESLETFGQSHIKILSTSGLISHYVTTEVFKSPNNAFVIGIWFLCWQGFSLHCSVLYITFLRVCDLQKPLFKVVLWLNGSVRSTDGYDKPELCILEQISFYNLQIFLSHWL